ncbi:hypothetical protein V2J09_003073 [Rumex salicifolius]
MFDVGKSSFQRTSILHFIFLLLLLVGCFVRDYVVIATEMESLDLQILQWRFQQIPTTSKPATCFPSLYKSKTTKGSTTLELKHRDSCTRPVKNLDKWLQKRLLLDETQVRSFQTRFKNPVQSESSTQQIPLSSGSRLQILNYVTTLQLGGRDLTVIVDTGSDLTWVQCQPCKSCYAQQEPVFSPSSSPSYHAVRCNTALCSSLQQATGQPGGCDTTSSSCSYYVSYGDGSFTSGDLATEKFSLGQSAVTNEFVFGCGQSNKGLFGSASGLMGLGRSSLSLVAQSSPVFEGVFSYCLPSGVDFHSSGSLTFGPQSSVNYKNTTPVSYTNMVWSPDLSSSYLLNLTGISVGGVDVHARSNVKVLIDSGTIITRLPPSVYTALKAEFLKQFSGYPSAPGYSLLDTCFDLSAYQEVNLPTVKLWIQNNVAVKVDVAGLMYFVRSDASQVCLAFASLEYEDELPIIGNFQQKNLRVVYDTKKSLLGFAQEECSL